MPKYKIEFISFVHPFMDYEYTACYYYNYFKNLNNYVECRN